MSTAAYLYKVFHYIVKGERLQHAFPIKIVFVSRHLMGQDETWLKYSPLILSLVFLQLLFWLFSPNSFQLSLLLLWNKTCLWGKIFLLAPLLVYLVSVCPSFLFPLSFSLLFLFPLPWVYAYTLQSLNVWSYAQSWNWLTACLKLLQKKIIWNIG